MPSLWRRMRSAFSPARRTAPIPGPFFNVVEQSDSAPAEIWLYGDVVEEIPRDWWTDEPIEGLYIALENVLGELERVRDATEIVIHLNSGGGDLFAGVTIHNLIRSFAGRKTVVVDGLAASAASVIMCSGDTVQVHPGSMVMIHNVSSLLLGYYSTPELRTMLNNHEAAETSILRIYGEKTNKSEAELQELIDATTWYVGQDAIDAGFADELIETPDDDDDDIDDVLNVPIAASLTPDGEYLMVAGVPHSVSALGQLPPWLTNQTSIPDVAAAAHGYRPVGGVEPANAQATTSVAPRAEEEGDMTITSVAELRDAYPELVAAVEADAATNERERMRSIDKISGQIRNPELVKDAMYEHPVSAAELALKAIQADNSAATAMVDAIDADAKDAIANDGKITAMPVETDEPDVIDAVNEEKFMAGVHEAWAAIHGTGKGCE